MKLVLDTPIIELYRYGITNLSAGMARKLAVALAASSDRAVVEEVTVEDLLNYLPARYEDRSNFLSLDKIQAGDEAAAELFVRTTAGVQVGKFRDRKKPPLYLFEITAGDRERIQRPVTVKWFISGKGANEIVHWYSEKFRRGTRFVAFGLWEADRRGQITLKVGKPDELEILPPIDDGLFIPATIAEDTPEEDILDPALISVHTGRVPVYRKLGNFSTKKLREIFRSVLDRLDEVNDDLPAEMLARCGLLGLRQAYEEIHFPPDGAVMPDYEMSRSPAHRRLIFDEFFWLAFAMRILKGKREHEPKGAVIEVSEEGKKRLASLLPFELTSAQKKVVREIFADLKGGRPMNRLIQGDVGSGKTIVAFLAIMAAMENGYQAALMAPTEILAEQHFRNARRIFAETGYCVELLTGGLKAAERRRVREAVRNGEANLVIGTHAVIQEGVEFDLLGLAVIDEQHRFGVMQRARLKELGVNPDVLVMTATPIPRSLAMTVYGDLDVSVIDELPPGRTPIKTVVCGEDQRAGVYRGIEREVRLGRQAYVVYPLVKESEKLDLKAATAMHEDLSTRIFPQFRIGLLHGKMKPDEKDAVMTAFSAGEIDVLVSTTVIEVGIDVPNASLMVIEHAERFGLSQLHQLRGRVGRGAEQSFCVLLTGDKKTAVARERLGIMERSSDGFEIAEKDLEIRGQGELLGTRQSGLQSFKIANIVRDLDILSAARNEVEILLGPKASSAETKLLKKAAERRKAFELGKVG
ncbi:MAG: ATP-dependent DNA helicase RecG [Acidobacteria bacterium OLB17]|nr:MAG: ATP-dependent DNA helicase RecG [Acidobacteria bacterium OLB17]MCZ2389477.1 ATP-dependent DNA helicase RecG [Acidobacteriota bacterium]